jgi:hypothetical protein
VLMRNSSLTGIALCWLALVAVGCGAAESDPQGLEDTNAGSNEAELRGGHGTGDAASAQPSDPNAPVACTLISEVADGVCARPDSDPCRFQDPDCSAEAEGYDCDVSQVLCRKAVQCDEGKVPTVLGSCYGPCVAADQCKPAEDPGAVACALFIEESDGVCSRSPDDPCKAQDPDCASTEEPTVCALFIEESDGVCSRSPDDPCKAQDPDCASTEEPVACLLFIEAPDGVCSRAADDPCKGQDPDCASSEPSVCAAFIEAPDGVCSRPANDPCKAQDPECI